MSRSKIYLKPDESEFSYFNLNKFEDVESERLNEKLRAEQDFKPDNAGGKEREFVLGGFTFDYHGGYKQDEVLKKVRDETDSMIAVAQAKVDEIEKTAHDKGFNAGHKEGHDESIKDVSSLITGLKQLTQDLVDSRNNFYAKAEKEMVDLVMLVASEVVRRELETGEGTIEESIRQAVSTLHGKQSITIILNQTDRNNAEGMLAEMVSSIENITDIELKDDDSITAGGCLLETNIGTLDATVEARMMAIYKNIKQRVYM